MKIRIGYFVPEFPSQTHAFFWREKQSLADLGVEVDCLSTRRPPREISSHTWCKQAEGETSYLIPMSLKEILHSFYEIFQAGSSNWVQCLRSIFLSIDTNLLDKFKLLALVVVSGKLLWLHKRYKWCHIHVHSCANSANILLFASLLSRSKLTYSITLHGPLSDYGSNQFQKWRNASFAIVITRKLYGEIQGTLAENLPKIVKIAPMGVDCVKFKRSQPYVPWDGTEILRIFSCGRLNPCKGHEYLIRAISTLKNSGIDVLLEIAGEDEQGGKGYHKTLDALIVSIGAIDSVKLLGAISEHEVAEKLESAHIFALASLHEPLGVAIMEAMAMEVPVIATDSGGVKELVSHNLNGILVPPKDSESLGNAIKIIAQSANLANRLSENARNRVISDFQDTLSADVLVECLEITCKNVSN